MSAKPKRKKSGARAKATPTSQIRVPHNFTHELKEQIRAAGKFGPEALFVKVRYKKGTNLASLTIPVALQQKGDFHLGDILALIPNDKGFYVGHALIGSVKEGWRKELAAAQKKIAKGKK